MFMLNMILIYPFIFYSILKLIACMTLYFYFLLFSYYVQLSSCIANQIHAMQ